MSKNSELTIAAETKIIKNNLKPFTAQVKKFISKVPTTLASDQDFENAKDFVKKAKEFEKQITAAQDKILNTGEIADITKAVKELKELVSSKRLEVDKVVKAADFEKKQAMIREAKEKIETAIKNSKMSRFLSIDFSDLADQIKGKRSYKVMETTLQKYAATIIHEINEQTEKLSAIYDLIQVKIEGEEHMFNVDSLMEYGEKVGSVIDEMKAKFKLDREKRRLEEEQAAQATQTAPAPPDDMEPPADIMDDLADAPDMQAASPDEPLYAFKLQIVFSATQASATKTAAGIRKALPEGTSIKLSRGSKLST